MSVVDRCRRSGRSVTIRGHTPHFAFRRLMTESSAPSEPLVGTLAITGVGLIGGSIAAAAKQRHVAGRIIGIGRTDSRLAAAVDAGLIDEGSTDIAAAADADLAVVCTPVNRIAEDVRALASVLSPEALLTDAGSTKRALCEDLADLDSVDGPAFIGSHPLAGSERQGFEHADTELFQDRICVVTPSATTRPPDLARLEQFWIALGAVVVACTPDDHDRTLARTSHLPHLVAAVLAESLQAADSQFTASGFRDTTRIASGDPSLWVPILRHNAPAVRVELDRLRAELKKLSDSLQHDDSAALQMLLEEAKRKRDVLG